MKFRTEINIPRADFRLDPRKPLALLGSCFAENIAARMRRSLWNASNPLGTLFNPLSIERAIRLLISDRDFYATFARSQFKTGRTFNSWLFDSRSSAEFQEETLRRVRQMREELTGALRSGTLFVTFGTAWCYFLASDPDFVVANCHKQPQSLFIRRRLSTDEIILCWTRLAEDLSHLFPGLRIVFTVSPVRHIKDSLPGNTVSKATLRLAVEEICATLPFCSYFPAFEILNDDLRDYRFYASDLVHPSEEAVDYIWDIFKATYLDEEACLILNEGEKLVKAWSHRPLAGRFTSVSELTRSEEEARLEKIRQQHAAFLSRYPGMSQLP